jgi:hypothetical protein
MDADDVAKRVRQVLGDVFMEPTDAQHQHAFRKRSR